MKMIDLKPSLLILHDIKLRGGIQYKVVDRTEEMETEKQELATWKTERIIFDKPEFDAARALRARCETLLQGATNSARSDIGLFAPDTPATFTAIENAEIEINELLDTYNREAYFNSLTSRVITFRIQSDNRQALEAVAEMISNGLDDLKKATAAADPKAIRNALKDIKGLDRLLPDQKSEQLKTLIETMRDKARKLTKEVNKAGRAITDDEVIKLMDASAIDRAALVIFDEAEPDASSPTPDAGNILLGLDADDFQTDDTEERTASPDATTAAPDLFQTDNTAAPAAAAPEPTARQQATAAATVTPDTTAEHTDADDWTDEPDPEPATDASDPTERAAALIAAYEAATTDAERETIRAKMEEVAAII